VARVGSNLLTPDDYVRLVSTANTIGGAEDIDGVLVTHGTDSLEETAIILYMSYTGRAPLLITGAQRTADSANPDGPANVRRGIACLQYLSTRRGYMYRSDQEGVLPRRATVGVEFQGEVVPAVGAFKWHSTDVHAFRNRITNAPLSWERFSNLTPQFHSPREIIPVPEPEAVRNVRVETIHYHPNASRDIFDFYAEMGVQGLIVVGCGVGNTSPVWIDSIRRLTHEGVFVVIATRTTFGQIVPYVGGGGAKDAIESGAVPVDVLPVSQARTALEWLLASGAKPEAVKCWFETLENMFSPGDGEA
jgi:L-asparaginase